jgi:hypothetical protein
VVNEDAIVRCYNLQGDFSQFSLGKVILSLHGD